MFSYPLSELELRLLVEGAQIQRSIVLDLLNYFEAKKKEDLCVYLKRFQNFKEIIQAVSTLNMKKTLYLLHSAIELFGQGQRTVRYADLLTRLKREAEKRGLHFFAQYFLTIDWKTHYLQTPSDVLRSVPSKEAVYQTQRQMRNQIVDQIIKTFFMKIDTYIAESENKINAHCEAIDSFAPHDEDSIIAYGLKAVQSQLISPYFSVSRNVTLSTKKILLLKQLKWNLLELLTDSPEYTIDSFIRGMYMHLLFACERNTTLVSRKGGEGKVNILLTNQLQCLLKDYPEDAEAAKEIYLRSFTSQEAQGSLLLE